MLNNNRKYECDNPDCDNEEVFYGYLTTTTGKRVFLCIECGKKLSDKFNGRVKDFIK